MDQVAGNKTRKNMQRNVRSKRNVTSPHEGLVHGDTEQIKPEQRLMQSRDTSNSASHHPSSERTSVALSNTGTSGPHVKETLSKNTDSAVVTNVDVEAKPVASTTSLEDADLDLDEQSIMTKELANLDKFREHQKMIEELNARKKKMLSEAIKQRQHKAKAESAKLNLIKQELDRLDQMVNSDISVIRDKIEVASRDFLEAQKRYDRAEREFIEAKTDLHSKSEAKDLLTEHLYTMIHQNEVRKARKLGELTHKLELEDDVTVDAAETMPVPLCLVMPMNQLTSHAPTSPPSTAAGKHTEQSPLPTDDTSNTQQTAEPQGVSSDTGHEFSLSSLPQSAETTDSVDTLNSNSTVPSDNAVGATE